MHHIRHNHNILQLDKERLTMAFRQKTPAERIAEAEKKVSQLNARIASDKAKIREQDRKNDTRRKIIAGALALEHKDVEFEATMRRLLDQYVIKPSDRALFDLPPLPAIDPETPPS